MKKICIIKLGADGDVLRTLPLAKEIKRVNPGSYLIWITKGDISKILQKIPYIDKVINIPYKEKEKFDILYNFDIEEEALKLALELNSDVKRGFYSDGGYPAPFNMGADYYLQTAFDDYTKKNNKKTYQEMMFEAAELEPVNEKYQLFLGENEEKYADEFFVKHNLIGKKVIGIHIGASARWPSKLWDENCMLDFVRKMVEKKYIIILFGGVNETKKLNGISTHLNKEGIKIITNNPQNTKLEFCSIVGKCSLMICPDSFSLHASIGLGVKTIGLFFCTSPVEVEGYGLLKKIISPMINEFFPQRMNEFNLELTQSILPDEVVNTAEDMLRG